MRICLFEDPGVANLEPLALTRPAFELLCGLTTLGRKQCRYFAPCEVGVLVRPELAEFYRVGRPSLRVNDFAWLRAEQTVLVNARWLPPAGAIDDLAGPCVGLVGDEVAYAVVSADRLPYCSSNTIADCLEVWKETLRTLQAGGRMIGYLWDLVAPTPSRSRRTSTTTPAGSAPARPRDVAVVGPGERLLIDPTARLDPHGRDRYDRRSRGHRSRGGDHGLHAHRGPVLRRAADARCSARRSAAAPRSARSAASAARSSAASCTATATNITTASSATATSASGSTSAPARSNSDLRNDYGRVSAWAAGRLVNTGQTKVGCFLGDHTKTGLGTLLNTGTTAGVFCNLLPSGGYLPKRVPSFASWWNGELHDNIDVPGQLTTAAEVMQRRQQTLTDAHVRFFNHLYRQTVDERWAVLRDAEQRRLRLSA